LVGLASGLQWLGKAAGGSTGSVVPSASGWRRTARVGTCLPMVFSRFGGPAASEV